MRIPDYFCEDRNGKLHKMKLIAGSVCKSYIDNCHSGGPTLFLSIPKGRGEYADLEIRQFRPDLNQHLPLPDIKIDDEIAIYLLPNIGGMPQDDKCAKIIHVYNCKLQIEWSLYKKLEKIGKEYRLYTGWEECFSRIFSEDELTQEERDSLE